MVTNTINLIALCWFLLLSVTIGTSTAPDNCRRTCSSGLGLKPTTVDYPFGFSSGCPIQLPCDENGNILVGEFKVLSIKHDVITITILADCGRPFSRIDQLFRPNFAPNSNNTILLNNCTRASSCRLPPSNVLRTHFEPNCGSSTTSDLSNTTMSCYSEDLSTSNSFINLNQLKALKCQSILSSISSEPSNGSVSVALDVQMIRLGWWLIGECNCSKNADCTQILTPPSGQKGYRCRCRDGFVGDGFLTGGGCHRDFGGLRLGPGEGAGLALLALAVVISILLVIRHYSPITSQIGENSFDVENFINGIAGPRRYPYAELKRMTNSFSIKLGQGGYESVYKGSLKDGRPVAVKILSDSKGSSGEDFFNEVASISRTSHVNVVALLGFCYERKRRALVYEFMPNGSLDKFITTKGVSNRCSPLECKVLYQITLGIARGLEYLHRGCNTRIVHFDIKPHNILLDQDFVPKISDFGLAKLWQGKESMVSMQGTRGTIGYIAPEVFCRNFGGVSHKSDVYSYGMLVLDMICGRYNSDVRVSHPSDAYFPDWIYREYLLLGKDITLNEITTEEEEEMTRKMIIVSLWCIQMRPSDRPSIKEVIEMLEGSVQALQVPPLKPFQASPERPQERENHSTTSSSSFNGKEEISILEPEIRGVDSTGAGNNILAPLN